MEVIKIFVINLPIRLWLQLLILIDFTKMMGCVLIAQKVCILFICIINLKKYQCEGNNFYLP